MADTRSDNERGAYEPVPARDEDSNLSVTILEGSNPKRTVSVPADMTIRQFKQTTFPDHFGKNIRIIHCGKLLSDENQMLGDCGLNKSPFLHVSISNKVSSPAAVIVQPESTTIDMDESVEESDRRLAILLSEREDAVIDIDGYDVESMPVREGDQQDFIWGFIFGACLGYVSIIWLWQPSVPRRQKLGIITGIMVFLIMGSSRQAGAPPSSNSGNTP